MSKKWLNPLRPWNPGRYTLEFTGYNRDFLLIQQYACDSLGCRSGDPDPLTDAKQDQTTGQRSFIHSLDLRPPQQNRPVMASFSSPFRTTYRYLVCLHRCFLLFSDGIPCAHTRSNAKRTSRPCSSTQSCWARLAPCSRSPSRRSANG